MGIHELAAAVIAEAVADLDNLGHQDKKLQKIAEDARNFLTTDRLNLWAHTIGLDPEAVQERINVKLGLEVEAYKITGSALAKAPKILPFKR